MCPEFPLKQLGLVSNWIHVMAICYLGWCKQVRAAGGVIWVAIPAWRPAKALCPWTSKGINKKLLLSETISFHFPKLMFYEFSDVSCPGCIFFAALSYLEYVQHLWFHVLVLHRDLFGYHFSPPASAAPFHVLVIETHISTDTALMRGSWSDFIGKSTKWGGRGYIYWNLPFWILTPVTETSEDLHLSKIKVHLVGMRWRAE